MCHQNLSKFRKFQEWYIVLFVIGFCRLDEVEDITELLKEQDSGKQDVYSAPQTTSGSNTTQLYHPADNNEATKTTNNVPKTEAVKPQEGVKTAKNSQVCSVLFQHESQIKGTGIILEYGWNLL